MGESYYQSVDQYSSNQFETGGPHSESNVQIQIKTLKLLDATDLSHDSQQCFFMLKLDNENLVSKPF